MWKTLTGVMATFALAVVMAGFGARAASASSGPIADAGGPYYAAAGLTMQFNGANSTGTNLGFFWMFDDGATATGVAPLKVFTTPGTHTVTLRVSDSSGLESTATALAYVSTYTIGTTAYSGGTYGAFGYGSVSGMGYSGGMYSPYGYVGGFYSPYGHYGNVYGTSCGYSAVYSGGLTCSDGYTFASPGYYPAFNPAFGAGNVINR